MKSRLSALLIVPLLTACAPEVGSESWCENLAEKDKSQWTLEETGNYAKHCIIKIESE